MVTRRVAPRRSLRRRERRSIRTDSASRTDRDSPCEPEARRAPAWGPSPARGALGRRVRG
jgi:hypothetical protein